MEILKKKGGSGDTRQKAGNHHFLNRSYSHPGVVHHARLVIMSQDKADAQAQRRSPIQLGLTNRPIPPRAPTHTHAKKQWSEKKLTTASVKPVLNNIL